MGDGPDQVHRAALAKALVRRNGAEATPATASAAPRPRAAALLF